VKGLNPLYVGKTVMEKVTKIALTDSVHSEIPETEVKEWFKDHALHWIQSSKPLDTPIYSLRAGCSCVSAGHPEHAWTTPSAKSSILKYFQS